MNENFAIQLFEGKKVRIVWDAEQEKYYFSVTDIVQVLTDSVNPRDYIKKMLRRDPELKSKWGTICPPVEMLAPDGKRRKTQAADLEGIFRIIQAIPSKKAEPVKQWLAELGSMRVDQMIDPELTFQMAVEDYRRQGYSDRWINERMRSIEMRKAMTFNAAWVSPNTIAWWNRKTTKIDAFINVADELNAFQKLFGVRANGTPHYRFSRRALLGHSIENFYRTNLELMRDNVKNSNALYQNMYIQSPHIMPY